LKTDHLVKLQPLHKSVFVYPECSQYKILTINDYANDLCKKKKIGRYSRWYQSS